ncbi:hypothetical protein SH528x_003427 [Novipirellula sp. SH528]|uniref:hypothetical protein n=1 Tax=Novipirellula sp. SH528 TaxID=3454466 RepID=UPI003F9FFC62
MIAVPTDVRTVLRLFRYATLHQFIGRRFTVSTHESLREDLSRLGSELAVDATLLHEDVRNLYLQIAKYGILDLRFGVAHDTFDCDFQSGKGIIRELGFGPDSASEWAEVFPEFEGMMPDIASDMHDNKWFLMIHANISGNVATGRGLVESIQASNDLTRLPLPSEFDIVDACVTNTTHAWFSKHFYL